MTGAGTVRLYGKLPAHGDFVSRGFTRGQAEACDAWLSASLADARAAHGAAFDARYDHAPPWRFAGEGLGGALAASQDAAGRRYPVLLLLDTTAPFSAAAVLEGLLYQAIAERWTADALVAAADVVELPLEPEDAPEEGRWSVEGDTATLSGACPPDLIGHLLAVGVEA